jgi:hypothetical protein
LIGFGNFRKANKLDGGSLAESIALWLGSTPKNRRCKGLKCPVPKAGHCLFTRNAPIAVFGNKSRLDEAEKKKLESNNQNRKHSVTTVFTTFGWLCPWNWLRL